MNMKAAMAYLRCLREKKGLSQSDIARAIGVEPKQVYRWEKCLSEPSSSSLAMFIRMVEGSPEHVTRLILDDKATIEEAEILTEEVFFEDTTNVKSKIDYKGEDLAEAMELVLDLRKTPPRLAQWVEYGKKLIGG